MEKPTIFKSVKTVFTVIKNIVSDTQKQFEKLEASFGEKPVMQPLFLKAIESKKAIFGLLLFLCFSFVNAQIGTDFSARLNGANGTKYIKVKGDVKLIGNTILTPKGEKLPYNGTDDNNSLDAVYLNVDPDGGNNTSSSSAELNIDSNCKEIVFAGLYWSAMYSSGASTNTNCFNCGTPARSDWNEIRFKAPGLAYQKLTADKANPKEVIFKGDGSNNFNNSVYVCFKDVTDLLKPLKNAVNGNYIVGNLRATTGLRQGGAAGGWTLVVIYEAPDKPSKFISVFDGARMTNVDAGVNRLLQVDIPIKGFQTLPAPFSVIAKIGVAALDGDLSRKGDALEFRQGPPPPASPLTAFTTIWNNSNPKDNFFNASITENDANVTTRNPSSINNLGFDIDYLDINNENNKVISNDATEGTFRLLTTLAGGDGYAAFLATFAVDIIEPKIVLTKVAKGVKSVNGVRTEYDITNQPVTLGQEIIYNIGFRNQGNDNAKDFTITDILPQNIIFDKDADILYKDTGIDLVSYDPATRTLVFKVANSLVVKSGGTYNIKLRVRVVNNCDELVDACSNIIKNTAVSRYFGDENPTNNGQPYGDKSYSFDTGCLVGDPTSTNFLVGVDQCSFNKEVSLCGSAVLTAANGFTTYVWKDEAGNTVATTRSYTAIKAGKYTVQTGGNPDCKGILQTFTVKDHKDGANVNPVSEYANNIVPATNRPETCTRDNIEFPKIFLCGLNDTRIIDTKISSAISIVWQETKDVPPAGFPSSCPYNEAPTWTDVKTGPTFTADRPGAFRIVVTYGNNCVNTFYFSVFQNPLDPKATKTDITCTTTGSITVTNPAINTGYTYSLDSGGYGTSNVFNNVSEGDHVVNIKQSTPGNGQTTTCPFFVKVTIIKETFTGTVDKTDPLCPGSKGNIRAFANGISGDYQFILKKAGTNTVITDSGTRTAPNPNYFDFEVVPGSYDVEIYGLKNKCYQKILKVVIVDKILTASVSTKPLACGDGEITINASGGTPIPGTPAKYYYNINGVDTGTNAVIPVTRPLANGGKFDIIVSDYAGCKFTIPTITFTDVVKPTVKINQKNVRCYNSKEGEISLDVTPTNSGFAVSYNVNGGTYTTLPTTGLNPGTYKVIVKYTYNGTDCFDAEQTITITGSTSPLIAAGGVAALSGCGLPGNTDQGLVRITNPQGGLPFPAPNLYRYSFDDGKTWITSNQAYVDPRATAYTLMIKDAADCVFEIKGIILQPKPAKPVFNVPPAVYNCKGEGTTTVTVQTDPSATYTYKYYLGKPDPANPANYIYTENTNNPNNVFKDLPAGSYKIKVDYNLATVATYSNLLKEDFGIGDNTTTPGIAAAYCYHDLNLPSTCTDKRTTLEDGQYVVTKAIIPNNGAWYEFRDHTYNGANKDARFLAINIGGAAGANGVLYSKVINDVIPNQPVIVEAYLANLFRANFTDGVDPSFSFELVNAAGTIIAQQPPIPPNPPAPNPTNIPPIPPILRSNKWELRTVSLDPGNNTTLTFRVRSGSIDYNGNDAAIDDITVYQLPKSCLADEILDLKVEDQKGFKAEVKNINGVKCKGDANGTFSIYAENFDKDNGFFYTLNGSATPVVWVNSKTSPVDFIDKPEGTYDIRVRYANDAASCNTTISTKITAPLALVVTASASKATCKVGATVTASAAGGNGGYTFVIKDKNSAFTKTFTTLTPTTAEVLDIPPGTYIVTGTDSKGCADDTDTELVIDQPIKPEAEVKKDSGLCFNTNALITVNITKGTGPYSYQVKFNGAATYSSPSPTFTTPSFTYTATAPGNYEFLITDTSNKCEAVAISQKIDPKITAIADITKALSCITGDKNATIEVTIKDGTSPYTYTVTNKATNVVLVNNGSTAGPKFTYSAVAAGTYVFDIKDANGCPFKVEKEVLSLAAVTATHIVVPVTCFNAADGYVDITPQTGAAPFTYQFNGTGAFTNNTHYGSLAGSVAGTNYTYIVKDNAGCTQDYSFKVFQPADIVLTASITTKYDCATGGATITASATNGNGGYIYVLKNTTTNTTVETNNTTGVFNNLTATGSYEVTVTDSKSCPKTAAVTGSITALNPPKGMKFSNSAVTCPTNKATVTITNVVNAAGVAVPTTGLEYRITAPAASATTTYQPGNSFAGLTAGTAYTFEVRDANKCIYSDSYTIKALPVITVDLKSQTPIKCSTDTDGTATFTVSGMGNSIGYSYKVDALAAVTGTSTNSGTSFDITVPGLSAGLHSITVTNTATTCFASQNVTIAAPAAPLKLNAPTLTHVTCDNKGTATINAVDGWGTYTYTVTPTAPAGTAIVKTTNVFANLNAGDYSVSVKDLNGCTVTGTFKINDKVDPIASIAATTDLCAGGAGATIRVTPNTAPNYVYSLNGATAVATGTFTGLIPGSYVVTVTDTSTGCFIDLTAQTVAKPVDAEIKINKILDCDPVSPNAELQITIKAGYPDYKYRVNATGTAYTGAFTPLLAGQTVFTYPAPAGDYYFQIEDSKGCTTIVYQKIDALVSPDFTAVPDPVKCKGAKTGTITVKGIPAAGVFTYVLTPTSPAGPAVSQSGNVFTGLGAGDYSIVIIDAKQCKSSPKTVTVKEPLIALQASASATKLTCGTNNASQAATITVTASNGTPFTVGSPYKYSYNGATPVDSKTFTINAPGRVNIDVTDANGCTTSTFVDIDALNPPSALAFSAPVITCDPAKLTTDLLVTVTNGVWPLKYEITSYTAAVIPGTLVKTVSSNTYTFDDLAPGTYNFKITDDNGCIKTGSYTIDPVVPIQVDGSIDKIVSCFNYTDGRLIFNVFGNITGGYNYTLVNGVGTAIIGSQSVNTITYNNLKAEKYTFTVTNTDTKCQAVKVLTLTNPTAVAITKAVGTKVYCSPKDVTTITITAAGGTTPLYYAVVPHTTIPVVPAFPAGFSTNNIFNKNTLTDGLVYDVYVQDKNGCPQTTTVTVTRDPVPTVDPISTTCYTGGNISILMSGTVFTGSAILYGVDGNYSSNATKTITGPGSYSLTVKDDNGCISAPFPLVITNQLKLTVTPNKDVTCAVIPPFTTTDAQVTLSAAGGNSTYVYEYKLGTGGTYVPITPAGNVFTTSVAGDYYFRVTSAGCSTVSTVPFTVTDPVKPVPTAVATGTKCTTSTEGTIKISVAGGTPPFTYTIDNWATSNSTGYFADLPGAVGAGLAYTYKVRDAKGCEVTGVAQAFVIAPSPITFTTDVKNIECDPSSIPPGSTLGSITVQNAAGGTGQYKYVVTSNFGYTNTFTTTTKEDHKFDIINFGIYTIEVIDQNNCSAEKIEILASPPNDLVIDVTTTPSTCTSGGTAVVKAVASVGSGKYEFGILEFNTPPYSNNYSGPDVVNGNVKTFNPLIPGVTYSFVVHDLATNCYFLKSAAGPIPQASTLVGTPIPKNVTCKGLGDGKVSFNLSGYDATTTSIDYQIFRQQDNAVMSTVMNVPASGATVTYPATGPGVLVPGRYYIVFTERGGTINGCQSASTMFEIKESTVSLSLLASSIQNDNCKPNAGIVKAVATGGTPPFLYQIVPDLGATGYLPADDTKPLAASFLPSHNASTFNVNSGDYLVWVKDANDCITEATVKVLLDPSPVIDLNIVNNCAVEGAFQVNVSLTTAGIAPYYISVNGGDFEEIKSATPFPYTIKGLSSGPVNVIVKDKNQCEDTDNLTITPTPLASALVTKVLDCSVVGNAVANAVITVTVKNGTVPYTYEVKKGAGSYTAITPTTTVAAGVTTFTYTVAEADADLYKFRITDLNTCPIETNEVTVDPIVPINASYTPIQPLCNGGNGTIELAATGGKGPYKYNFNNLGFTTTTTYSIGAGTYTYVVQDALLCEVTKSATLGQPAVLAVGTPVITPLKCGPLNAPQSATVVLSATGGTGIYKYSFKGSAFDTNATYTVPDSWIDPLNNPLTIPYAIEDANGCSVTGSVDIYKLNPPTNFTITQGPVITCTTLNTTAVISLVQNGVGTLTYQRISPTFLDNGTVATFTNLLPDVDYVFQVTDGNFCTVQKPFRINNVIKIKIVEQSTTPITCLGAADGKASFFVSGFGTGVGNYRYELDGAAVPGNLTSTTINLTGLAAGPHKIEVFDNETGCSMPLLFNIAAPATALILDPLVVTPLGCTTQGAVTMTAHGGWGNYTYTVKQPDGIVLTNTNGVFENLIQTGPAPYVPYIVSVKDANGCILSDSFTLIPAVNPVASISIATDYCYTDADKATIVVTASSASTFVVTPYEYSINNGQTWQLSDTFSDLNPGTYSVKVKDKFGCISVVEIATINTQLFAKAEMRKDLYCIAPVDGIIRVEAVGGYPPYTYTVQIGLGGTSAPIAFTNALYSDYTVTTQGTYKFIVYDTKGCPTPVSTVIMDPPTVPLFTAAPTSPYCAGGQGNIANGSILITLPIKDNGPYTYSILRTVPAGGVLITQSTPLFTDLIAGTYTVDVTSDRKCSNPQPVTITDPVLVVASASASPFTCSATNTLNQTVVTVRGTGGAGTGAVADYTYSENGTSWKTTNTFNVTDNGLTQNLTYYVKDKNGCIDEDQIQITAFPRLASAVATLGTKAACNNAGVEVINVAITGGATPYSFEYQAYQDGVALGGVVTLPVGDNSFAYSAPTAGHFYEFIITDKTTTCSIKTNAYNVPLYNIAKVIASSPKAVSCNGLSDGTIAINVIDYNGPYTYQVFNNGVAVLGASGSGDVAAANPFTIPFGFAAGTKYTVVVTETAYPFCDITSADVEVTQPAVLDLTRIAITNVNQNCKTAGAVLTIDVTTIKGGTGGYKYAFVPAGTVPDLVTGYDAFFTKTIATTKVAPLYDAYDVYVKDANDCPKFVTVRISLDPMPSITNVTVASQCYSTAGYRIDVAATGVGTLEYSLDGKQFQTDDFFTVFSAGNYTVSVRDANKCIVTAAIPVTVLAPLTLRAELTKVPTCKAADGTITLFAGGGTVTPPSYVYIKNGGTPQPGAVFTNLAPGTYFFKVRDIATNCEIEIKEIIADPTPVTGIVAKPTPVTCNGLADGTITVTLDPSNDNPKYLYSLAGPVARVDQESNIFTDLPFGNYVVTVTSGRGCFATAPAVIIQPDAILVTLPTVKPYACTTGNAAIDATITVAPGSVTGGSLKYIRYEFIRDGIQVQNDTRNTYTESDYLGGDYVINVFDENGCKGSYATVTIDPYIGIADLKLDTTLINCRDDESVQVTAIPTKGTLPALRYTIEGTNTTVYPVTASPTGLFAGLKPGTYLITVTNQVTGCSVERPYIVNEPNTFSLVATNVKDVTCFTDTNGSITLTLVDNIPSPDDAGIFTYTITHESGSVISGITTTTRLDLSNLKVGKYKVVAALQNVPYCPVTAEFTIQGPVEALKITVSPKAITCESAVNGEIVATAVGGWQGDYVYKLEGPVNKPYSDVNKFVDLPVGDYKVYVKDVNGCEDVAPVKLVLPTPVSLTIVPNKTDLTCYDDVDGTITVNAIAGGSGNFTYTLHGTLADGTTMTREAQPDKVFTGLGAGTYYVTVTDDWTCPGTSNTVEIKQPEKVKGVLSLKSRETCDTTPVLTLTFEGGTAPYKYSTDGITYSVQSYASSVDIPLPKTTVATVYKYFVRDANNCLSAETGGYPIAPIPELIFEKFTHFDIPCKGGQTGSIYVEARGGLGNFVYTLVNADTNLPITPAPTQLTPGTFTNLPVGRYKVNVNSEDCDKLSDLIEITQPDENLTADVKGFDVTCAGYNNGKITIVASGGTAPYTYSITPKLDQAFDVPLFENLKPGEYIVRVQDSNVCYEDYPITISDAIPLVAAELLDQQIPEYCFGDKNGMAVVKVSGGKPDYEASIIGNGVTLDFRGTDLDGDKFIFTDLVGGVEYKVIIRDANINCETEVYIKLPESVKLNPVAKETYDCENDQPINYITVTVDPSIDDTRKANIVYELYAEGVATGITQKGNPIFKNLLTGNYSVQVSLEGCSKTSNSVHINTVAPLTFVNVTQANKELNIIEVKASGGFPPYQYNFNDEGFTSSNTYRIYKTGQYKVVVIDQNGCRFEDTVTGTFYDFCMPNYFTPDGDGKNDLIGPDCGALAYKDLTFDIFDRYGRVIAKYHVGQKWDGRYNGAELPTGDYWYVLKLNDEKDAREFVGHFTLYR